MITKSTYALFQRADDMGDRIAQNYRNALA